MWYSSGQDAKVAEAEVVFSSPVCLLLYEMTNTDTTTHIKFASKPPKMLKIMPNGYDLLLLPVRSSREGIGLEETFNVEEAMVDMTGQRSYRHRREQD